MSFIQKGQKDSVLLLYHENPHVISRLDIQCIIHMFDTRLNMFRVQNAWTLWFFKNDKARTWEENQRPILTVATVRLLTRVTK